MTIKSYCYKLIRSNGRTSRNFREMWAYFSRNYVLTVSEIQENIWIIVIELQLQSVFKGLTFICSSICVLVFSGTTAMNWIQRKIYLYNVTFGLYMLDWWERYLFSILHFDIHSGASILFIAHYYACYKNSKLYLSHDLWWLWILLSTWRYLDCRVDVVYFLQQLKIYYWFLQKVCFHVPILWYICLSLYLGLNNFGSINIGKST